MIICKPKFENLCQEKQGRTGASRGNSGEREIAAHDSCLDCRRTSSAHVHPACSTGVNTFCETLTHSLLSPSPSPGGEGGEQHKINNTHTRPGTAFNYPDLQEGNISNTSGTLLEDPSRMPGRPSCRGEHKCSCHLDACCDSFCLWSVMGISSSCGQSELMQGREVFFEC